MANSRKLALTENWLLALLLALALGASTLLSPQSFADGSTDDVSTEEHTDGDDDDDDDDSPGNSGKGKKDKDKDVRAKGGKPHCQKSAQYLFLACKHRSQAQRWERLAGCENILDNEERQSCFVLSRESLAGDKHNCKAERNSRKGVCEEIGREVYQGWDDVTFVDGADGGNPIVGNDYFPLEASTASYITAETTIDREVTTTIREIDGVACKVVVEEHRATTDTEAETSTLLERVERLYAQDVDHNVWTCGVMRQQYDVVAAGEDPVVVSTEGSWETGIAGAKAGIAMRWQIVFNDPVRRSYAPGVDEELAEVIDPATVTSPFMCGGDGGNDCVILRITSPRWAEGYRDEYYESGTGLVHSEDQIGEETVDIQP